MYENLPLDALVPNPDNSNRISRSLRKKLHHNIREVGLYETLTVRPHPQMKGKFEVLNGHARIDALRAIGISSAKCDIWEVSDSHAHLFLAILNKLRGSEVPELRMGLLLKLLGEVPREQLAGHLPENASYLEQLERLPAEAEGLEPEAPAEKPDVTIVEFYLTADQHRTVSEAIERVRQRFGLTDSSQALAKLSGLYLEQSDQPLVR
jgi:ParB-like chromosome segregation protein Spo0J